MTESLKDTADELLSGVVNSNPPPLGGDDDDTEVIFRPYFVKNGKIIYPKNGKVFPMRVKKGSAPPPRPCKPPPDKEDGKSE